MVQPVLRTQCRIAEHEVSVYYYRHVADCQLLRGYNLLVEGRTCIMDEEIRLGNQSVANADNRNKDNRVLVTQRLIRDVDSELRLAHLNYRYCHQSIDQDDRPSS